LVDNSRGAFVVAEILNVAMVAYPLVGGRSSRASSVSPEVAEARGRQLGITHRVLDVFVA